MTIYIIDKHTRLLFLILVNLIVIAADAQLKGRVEGEQHMPIPYVSVLLSSDSSFEKIVRSTVTNDSGYFSMDSVSYGTYYLRASFVGFKTFQQSIVIDADNRKEWNIILKDTSSELGAVVIQSRRPTFTKLADKFVFHVANSSITTGGTAFDVIRHTPLVIAKNDGNINIAGAVSGATVYINNRKSLLTGTDLMNYLRSMPSDNIISVEVITNPSAKYEAGTSGGIINILLKKNYDEGLNGTLTVSDRQNKFNEQHASLILNYRKNRYSQMFQVSGRNGKDYGHFDFNMQYPQSAQSEDLYEKDYRKERNGYFKTAVDYQLSRVSSIGGNIDYSPSDFKTKTYSDDYIYYATRTDSLKNEVSNPSKTTTASANLYFKYNDNARSRSLDFNIDGFSYFNRDRDYFSSYYMQNGSLYNRFQSSVEQHIKNYSFKLDYSQPVFWKMSAEIGGKYTYTQTKNPYDFSNWVESQNDYVYNPGVSNYFIYREKIAAAYLSLQKKISDQWTAKAGMRMENTHIENIQRTTDETYRQGYTRWLPSAFLSYAVNDNNTLSLALRSDFNRPSYWEMNPFLSYSGNKVGIKGNPFLQPSKSLRLELSYILHQNYVFMASYGKETNLFQQVVTLIPPDTLLYYRDNYGYSKSFTLTSVVNQTVIKGLWNFNMTNMLQWLTLNVTANQEYYKNTYPIYVLNMNNDFTNIGKTGIDASLSGQYISRYAQSNMVTKSFGNIDLGFSKNFVKQDLRLSVAFEDILYTNYYRLHTLPNAQMTNSAIAYNNTTRLIRISLVKRFGNKKMKQFKNNGSSNTEEKSRL